MPSFHIIALRQMDMSHNLLKSTHYASEFKRRHLTKRNNHFLGCSVSNLLIVPRNLIEFLPLILETPSRKHWHLKYFQFSPGNKMEISILFLVVLVFILLSLLSFFLKTDIHHENIVTQTACTWFALNPFFFILFKCLHLKKKIYEKA